jgi:amidohydrolase
MNQEQHGMTASSVIERANAIGEQITSWRRDIHQHPELGFEEYRTSELVADQLRAMGWQVQSGIGKTGVVGKLGSGKPVVGIRADMDALPIQELNEVEYASQTPGVMHACGHDAHTAMLLGVARVLADMPDRPSGEIRLFFQPCEETEDDQGRSGAMRMIAEGALEGVDRVIALHVASDLPAGKIVIEDGYNTAAVDNFHATIAGNGCHGAFPHRGVDPIYLLAQVINALHGIRARRINPIYPAVVSIGTVQGGTSENVIPDEVRITGTLRSYHDEVREQLWSEVEGALSITQALGGDYALKILKGCPSVYNHPEVGAVIRHAAHDLFGEDSVIRVEPGMGAEDFSFMTRTAPGAMFLLGAKRDSVERPHHNPRFDLDESVFPMGTALLAESACRLLRDLGA